jgi:GNAT superfamily N-acetyltransferase
VSEIEFEIRPATDADQVDVIRLVSEMHGYDVTPRVEWLYRGNPHGVARSWIAVASGSGRVEGVTSVFPRCVIVDGTERLGSIGGDCYVAPAARRRGIATRLHEATRDGMGACGIDFMYGAPLVDNLRALVRAGASEVTDLKRYVRPLSGEFLEDLAPKLPAVARGLLSGGFAQLVAWNALAVLGRGAVRSDPDVVVTDSVEFGAEWDEWVVEQYPADGVFCVRDSAYMKFRYTTNAPARYTPYFVRVRGDLCGMFALERATDGQAARLGDVVSPVDEPSVRRILRAAADVAAKSGNKRLDVQATPHPTMDASLRAEGFWERDRDDPWTFQVLAATGVEHGPTINASASWFFMEADQDLG